MVLFHQNIRGATKAMARETEKKLHWFDKKAPRTVITIILTASATVCGGLITRFPDSGLTILFIVLTVLFVILQVLFSIHCATFDKFREISVSEMESKIKVYKKLFEELPQLFDAQAAGLNKIAKDIKTSGIIPGDRWTFDDASTHVCASIAHFIRDYSSTSVNVYYVKIMDDLGTKVKMVGCSNDLGDVPSTYMIDRPVIKNGDAYFDIKMFDRKKLHAEFRLNPNDVDNVFSYNDREKESGKKEQFLFIPVSCDKRKMIGLIEIIVPKGNKMAESELEMKNIQKLLKIYSSVFILLYKAEKAAIALPNP